MKWPKAMRCLGIFIGHDKERNEKLNWFDKIEKNASVDCIMVQTRS